MHTRIAVVAPCLTALLAGYQPRPASTHNANIDDYKTNVIADVDKMAKQSQVMVDMVFSFGELGFQEVETSKYLTGILKKEGFKIKQGIAGIPTAWIATWARVNPSSRSAPTSIAFPKRRRNPVLLITIR
jgi:aminobenzoyl-glutamate utilization protein B